MTSKLPETIYDVETPCFLVDIDKVKRNCQTMSERCKKMGVDLRPHMKTHKTIEGGELMTGGTKRKIVVSTLDEAEFYADHGFEDILFGIVFIKNRVERCKALANRLEKFHLLFDSAEAIKCLSETKLEGGKKWSVFIKIDCGTNRTGVLWDDEAALSLSKLAVDCANIEFQGIYAHCGNTYKEDKTVKTELQVSTVDRVLHVVNRLKEIGIECKTYGTGSTPSCSDPRNEMASLTEFHPGNYIFYDFQQCTVHSCAMDDIAVKVATRVLSHKPSLNMLLVDAGFAALTKDGYDKNNKYSRGICPVEGHPNLKLEYMTQEITKVRQYEGTLDYSKYKLGSMLFMYPYHACASAMMHPVYYIHSGDKIVGTWKPTRGW